MPDASAHPALIRCRQRRGWSAYAAAQRMGSVSEQQLKNLENGRTEPQKVRVGTMLSILRVYEELDLDAFLMDESGWSLSRAA